MAKEQVSVLERSQVWSDVGIFTLVSGITLMAPFFQQQAITGIIVNAMLFVATALLGVRMAIVLAFLPSVIALSLGTLPAPLAPMIPYIMVSNVLLVFVFDFFQKKQYWVGVVLSSIFKFAFLYFTSHWILSVLSQKSIGESILMMMSFPQLFTALLGGVLAYGILLFFSYKAGERSFFVRKDL